MRLNVERDPRLTGGLIRAAGDHVGVLYNADGVPNEALATISNVTIAVLTRNRSDYLRDLLRSVESGLPSCVDRFVLVNNTDDGSCDMLRKDFPTWRVDEVHAKDFAPVSRGLEWLRANRPSILPVEAREHAVGYGPTDSIAWLRNRLFRKCKTRFLVSFDDDLIVKPGWLDYLLALQNSCYAHGVINNFASYLIDTTVVKRIGWFDERFLRTHGYEDNDFLTRMNEARLRWVLGFNANHDWRSAEEGNPRGSATGSDLFIHRYAKMSGGFSASLVEHEEARKNSNHFGNWCWYRAKWEEVKGGPGTQDRPPFKGYFLKRREVEEPDWYAGSRPGNGSGAVPDRNTGKRTTQNTPLDELDPILAPAASTRIDRYAYLSHWCKGKDVLDAGCGHGYGSALLYCLGAETVVGVDLEESAIAYAKSRYDRPGLSFRKEDLLNLPEDLHGKFDTVTCVGVLEHVAREQARPVLQSLRKAIRPGGTLLVTTARRKPSESEKGKRPHPYPFSCDEYRAAVASALADTQLSYLGIHEFQVEGSPQWFSSWSAELTDNATVMVAVAQIPDDAHVAKSPTASANTETKGCLPRLSILISNRNTLSFLKLALKSCREHLLRNDHEIIVYDDASTDGSLEWLRNNAERYRLKILSNPGPERKGIVYVYDEMVQAASEPVILLVHSDMFFARNADAELWRHFNKGVVSTCTRIEPPLHQEEPFRILKDFGLDAATFQEEAFLRFAERRKDPSRTTNGIFAPILAWREDYLSLGGHDKAFAPQSREDSDLFARMQLAGLRFTQSWSSFCYHFSGRGSRRKDSATRDSEEWRESNAKNERNFVRKWGHSVRHDHWLKPIVSPRCPVTVVGLLGNERENVTPWLSHLEPYFEEILLIDDSDDGSADAASAYMASEGRLSPLVWPNKLKLIRRKMDGDWGGSRNLAQQSAAFDWLLHVDLDERFPKDILERLQDLIAQLERDKKAVCGFHRLNTLEGVVVNDLPRSEWTPEGLYARAKGAGMPGEISNRDTQFRLVRREIRWTPGVHEMPEPVAMLHTGAKVDGVVVHGHAWIQHEKTLRRQAGQDLRYQQIAGSAGPHIAWNPRAVLAQLGASSPPRAK